MTVRDPHNLYSCRDTESAFLRRISPDLSSTYDTAQIADESHDRAVKKSPIDKHAFVPIMNERSFRKT